MFQAKSSSYNCSHGLLRETPSEAQSPESGDPSSAFFHRIPLGLQATRRWSLSAPSSVCSLLVHGTHSLISYPYTSGRGVTFKPLSLACSASCVPWTAGHGASKLYQVPFLGHTITPTPSFGQGGTHSTDISKVIPFNVFFKSQLLFLSYYQCRLGVKSPIDGF